MLFSKRKFAICEIVTTILISPWVQPQALIAQTNLGFESGIKGWIMVGIASHIVIDSGNAYEGKYSARLGSHCSVMQRINVSPLSIISYTAYLKCSDEKVIAHCFIRFYDARGKKLLEYKGAPISGLAYQKTGDYTEAPPATKHATIGVERDTIESGSVFVDNLSVELNIGLPRLRHPALCNINQYMEPFWKADTIYNETVLLYASNGLPATGKLLFVPRNIISVKSFDLNQTYSEGEDFSLDGNNIIRSSRSKMPFRADTTFDKKNNLAWYNLQSQWVVVTYTHESNWNGTIPTYKGHKMPGILAKLNNHLPVKIVAYGMSITRGMNISGYDTVAPFMPTYMELFTDRLKKIFSYNDIILYNASLPGAGVDWGAVHAKEYVNPLKPDLVIIDFGMNDFWRYTPEIFKGYITTIIDEVKRSNPRTEFLLLSNMKFDPEYILDSDKNKQFYTGNLQGYNIVLQQLEREGIIDLDMTTISDQLYRRKKAKDCTTNPLHPNDYLARWYAQAMTALFQK